MANLAVLSEYTLPFVKVDGYLKGRIRGVNVVIIVIKVIRDKAIKRLIYNLNKLKEEL